MKRNNIIIAGTLLILLATASGCKKQIMEPFTIGDLDYFEKRGVNILVFNNTFTGDYNDEKDAGIEIIHHGVRTVQGGAVRLNTTPEQWDLVPKLTSRSVNKKQGKIEVSTRYDDYEFESRITVTSNGPAVDIEVYLDEPIPIELEGEVGFNLEFLPSQYWNKSYLFDGRPGRFPRYAAGSTELRPNSEKIKQYRGYKTYDDRGTDMFVEPLPVDSGKSIIIAPECPERMIRILSNSDIFLYDGRMIAQNGWYVLRSELPSGQTGKVLSWTIEPNSVQDWIREPNIGFSQVGYYPSQQKISVIELDKNDKLIDKAQIVQIMSNGSERTVFEGNVVMWGEYYKYNYAKFDFTDVNMPGIYYIQYGNYKTENFIIDKNVYDNITTATSDIWLPVHMNHIAVNEAYRVWHGEPFREGYRQAPPHTQHFDLHSQGSTTATKYKAGELIPGLNVGGYFDAGDFDIETSSNISVVQTLCRLWEFFKPERDFTYVNEQQRYVDIHRPDGRPDILQYIEHGVLNLLAQSEQIGHMSQALSNSVLDNYHHLGDAATITDGRQYDPNLKPYEISQDGHSSGVPDDMWAFTDRNPYVDINAANVFLSAARAFDKSNPQLVKRLLKESEKLRTNAEKLIAQRKGKSSSDISSHLQLYIATGQENYRKAFLDEIWEALEKRTNSSILIALEAVPFFDDDYDEKLKPYIVKYKDYLDSFDKENPYGLPIGRSNWAGNGDIISFGTIVVFAALYYPDIIGPEYAYKTANWLFGCHPYHNYSFVATLGATHPKQVFYGNNRADFSFIPGNVAPGVLFRNPDHFENFDDWPFIWSQNEGTTIVNVGYLIFGYGFQQLIASLNDK